MGQPDDEAVDCSDDSEDGRVLKRITLPHRQEMVIRTIMPADVDALDSFYGQLNVDDRYRRFFSGYRPPRRFVEQMARVAERGGFGTVAAVKTGPGAPEQIVAEAGYTLLPNGDGELGITVAHPWRGWLGPFLLDVLLTTAASHGVPNLEADVLAVNRSMLAIARARGCVIMEHEDWPVVRVLIGAGTETPTWPTLHGQPRVLVEGSGTRWHAEHEARAAGMQVLACPGPTGLPRACPALRGLPCPLAAAADAIVVSHPLDEAGWRALISAHHDLHGTVPVCLEISSPEDAATVDAGVHTTDSAGVVALLERLTGSGDAPAPTTDA